MAQMLIHMTVHLPQDTQGLPFHPGWAKQVSKWLLPAPVVEHEEKDLGAEEPLPGKRLVQRLNHQTILMFTTMLV